MSNELKPPESRGEKTLHDMIGGNYPLEPSQSRVESLLAELKEVIEQGGGSGLESLRVNVSSEDWRADHTQAEILAAMVAGRRVEFSVNLGYMNVLLTTLSYDGNTGILEASGTGLMPDGSLVSIVYTLNSDDSGNRYITDIAREPFIVEFTVTAPDMSGYMDKTVGEILDAYNHGQEIRIAVNVPGSGQSEIALNNVNYVNNVFYPSFQVVVPMVDENLLIVAYTATTDDPDDDQYYTKLYPLTTMQ